jgi:protein-disulfide isomerase
MIDQPHEDQHHEDKPREEKPALTVVIQSWWTPALALITLVVGLLGGYFGRPLINQENKGSIAVVTQSAANPTATIDATQQAITAQQVMTSLISQTKHFQGDPNATVTLIEFSDYQ